jgi:hypothetical protein
MRTSFLQVKSNFCATAKFELHFHMCYQIFARKEMGTHKPLVVSPNIISATLDHHMVVFSF